MESPEQDGYQDICFGKSISGLLPKYQIQVRRRKEIADSHAHMHLRLHDRSFEKAYLFFVAVNDDAQ